MCRDTNSATRSLPEVWATFYSTSESGCGRPSPLDGSTLITYAAICLAANSTDIPGRFQSSSIDSIMGFLHYSSKVLTFSANAPMTLSWSSAVSGSVADHATDGCPWNDILGVDVLIDEDNKFNIIQPSLKVHVEKHIANHHYDVRTVSIN